jgi:solute:Na+ symporter, SSS family
VLFMLSTSLSQDLYRRFVRPGATDAQLVRVARGAAIAGGLAGVSLAVALDTVVQALQGFYAILTVAFFVPVVAAVHARRTAAPEAMSAIVGGIATMVVVHVATAGAGIGGWRPNVLGLLAAGAAFFLVRAAGPERP